MPTLLSEIFWEPIAGITLGTALVVLAPAIIFDFFWGWVLRVGVVAGADLGGVARSAWRHRRLAAVERESRMLQWEIARTREMLAQARAAGEYREAEAALRWVREYRSRLTDLERRLETLLPDPPYRPRVSVIVPCHNSEDVIEETLDCLTLLTYPHLEIVVVDDGSTDGTAERVAEFTAPKAADGGAGPPIRLVRRQHTAGLKTSAINFGLTFASGEVIVVVDDDTRPVPDAIEHLVAPLAEPHVAACGGNLRATADRRNLLVRVQEIEYRETMEFGRSWQSLAFGAVFVISGAFGAFRREALSQVGAHDVETVAEDLDVTWKLYRLHRLVRSARHAVATTAVPDNARALVRQRRRWDYGLLQTFGKHRNMIFNRRNGAVGMLLLPEVLIIELALTAVKPLYVLALLLFGFELWRIVLLTFYFYVALEVLAIISSGLLAGERRRSFEVYYAPLVVLYRTWLSGVRLAAIVRYARRRPPGREPGKIPLSAGVEGSGT